MNKIEGFFKQYGFLSNFYSCKIEFAGVVYDSVEHAYQAAKTHDLEERELIRDTKNPGMAKKLGNQVKLRSDWESIKLDIMYNLVQQKFYNNTYLMDQLLSTGDVYLEETNYWRDTFWGVCNGIGENHLGKILMRVREELKNEQN